MPKVLIISPYFPPSNAADMQRIRTSLPYFEKFGWIPEVVCVAEKYSDMPKDPLLIESIPDHIKIHQVNAFSKKLTSKFGLGSIALRSLWFYKRYVNQLLQTQAFDLIYFSTTQFPVCTLGSYWKKKFNIPYVIDMQDPWHTDYYESKPKEERPKKYWFSYRLNKYLEPIAMNDVDGLISVSKEYITTLQKRYPKLESKPFDVIPFGSHNIDFQIADKHIKTTGLKFQDSKLNLVYIGAVGHIMKESILFICRVLAHLKTSNYNLYQQIHLYFIGTSYAPGDEGMQTVIPLAITYGVEDRITEQPKRMGYFESLATLKRASALLILGSDDQAYSPSKIFTYALAEKPVIAVFKSESPATQIIKQYCEGLVLNYEIEQAGNELELYLTSLTENHDLPNKINMADSLNTAEEFTEKQCRLFDQVSK